MVNFDIKVCGITRVEDARKAAHLGARLIGLIFYPKSPRYVTVDQARDISQGIEGEISRVGVFVDATVQEMDSIASKVGLEYLQVHGALGDGDLLDIHTAGLRVIRPYHIQHVTDYDQVYRSKADYVMLDNATKAMPGGTGKTFDWSLRPPRPIRNLVLAGGINESNIEDGVRLFTPAVVDVNSGVESEPGMKSPEKMERLFEICARLQCEQS
ncbi:N-(5'-phosphoribosyl)anthranilate isomerase [candidate division GN15 bacterium]|nr:N-(5'-phosphoribosyl)anthranilate isomerase [candidate division GN15 bacterium]